MKKILLPTDFSANAYNAISYGMQLFAGEACKFFLLNTYTPVLYDNEYLVYSAAQPTLTEIYREKSQHGLERVFKKLKKNFKNELHEFELISSFNLLSEEIRDIVNQKEIDLVIMGTKGATGAEEILFGTHTVHAIKKVRCPLLAIPAHFEFRPPKEILFPTDFEAEIPALLKPMKQLVKTYASTVNVLHVYSGLNLNQVQAGRKKALTKAFKDYEINYYSITDKSVARAIYDFTEDNPVDLLVMVNNKHSFFENLLFRPVVNEIGFNVKVPFLVIPSNKRK